MLNVALCDVYTPEVIVSLKQIAEKLEAQGRRAIVCFPEKEDDIVIPGIIFIDGANRDMSEELHKITDDNVSHDKLCEKDYPLTMQCHLSIYTPECGGLELWVK